MKQVDQTRLQEKLARLTADQKRSLYKQAARKRKTAMQDKRPERGDLTRKYHGDDLAENTNFERRGKRGAVSLDEWALQILDQGDFDVKAAETDTNLETHVARVMEISAGQCRLLWNQDEISALVRPELTMGQRSDLAVGDNVRFYQTKDGSYRVEEVMERCSVLSRPDPHDVRIERVIAANIDLALIVGSLYSPPLCTNLLDRYLLATERGGITPVICINKIDLADKEEMNLDECMHPYRELKVTIVRCCATDGYGMDALIELLKGKTAVIVGQSGVGKSSILNAIDPRLELQTAETRRGNLKGRHTTVKSNLYRLEHDICVIDTPGIRSFGLWKMTRDELRWYFNEFEGFAGQCKFSDCTHTHEPECAIRDAVDNGMIRSGRYDSYCRMLDGLQED